MSVTPIKLFATQPHDCSYIKQARATTLFVDPDEIITSDLYMRLSNLGFRRSGAHMYKPHCADCDKCIATRVVADGYKLTRSDKRVLKKNSDLKLGYEASIETSEHYSLFESYINERHSDGDMYPPSWEQYADFLGGHCDLTRYLCARDGDGRLIMVAVIDTTIDGLSAVYTFFAPDQAERSLGHLAILLMLQLIRESNNQYLYLGYLIEECSKMAYKTRYQPLEILQKGEWIPFKG